MTSTPRLTPQEEAFVQALDDLRKASGLGCQRFARALGGIPIDTMKSLLYRRRRPSPAMVSYLEQRFRADLLRPLKDRDRALIERIVVAAQVLLQ